MNTPDILALGEAMIEFVRIPDGEPRVLYEQGFGGDTSNTIIAAARQGANTGYLTAIGNEDFGQSLIELWHQEGVNTEHVIRSETNPTGAYFVNPHVSRRSFSYLRQGSAAGAYAPADLPIAAISNAKIMHSSALSMAISAGMRASVMKAAEISRSTDTLFSFDTNLRLNLWSLKDAKAAISQILPFADIILPSDDEAQLLTGLSDPDAILDHYLDYGAQIVALKRGAEGVMIATGDARHEIPAAQSNPIDSTGAGDSFAGAFLAYYLETEDVRIAGERAAKVAAAVVSGYGAADPIPHRDDIV